MQISSGWAKGLKLETPKGEATRPTSARVRAAILNLLQPDLEDALVLDLFAGSGALGIEAVSRGARGAVFVEKASAALACLRKNVTELERRATKQNLAPPEVTLVARDVAVALETLGPGGRFDIICMDPPYAKAVDWLERVGPVLAGLARETAVFVFESASEDAERIAAVAAREGFGWRIERTKEYGDTMVTTWTRA